MINNLYGKLANSHADLKQARVRCETCKRELDVDSAACFAKGWPKCCGYTMTLLPVRAALSAVRASTKEAK